MPSGLVGVWSVATHTIPTSGGIFHYRGCPHGLTAVLQRQISISWLVAHRFLDTSASLSTSVNPEVAYRIMTRMAAQLAVLLRTMDEKFVELVGYIWGRSKK